MRHGTGKMRIAAIMDILTRECYGPECDILELTPYGWKRELTDFRPEMVLVESAWFGKDSLWQSRLDRYSAEMAGIAAWCRKHEVPLVYWGKEDPVHMARFLPTAYWADVVFTTAAECIGTYKKLLGHRQVYHLHFAAQPRLHNPIESFGRLDRCCFAGAYYADFPDRCRVFEELAGYLSEAKGLDIYDRFAGKASPLNIFPEKFQPYILGHLAPADIGRAYKGYMYNLNLNSITDSQTMFSRRVFELMASNTVVISNKSSGMEKYFGMSIISADNAEELRGKLASCCDTEEKLARFRLHALRQVAREHLYEDRLSFIVSKVFGGKQKIWQPKVCVFSRVNSREEEERVRRMFEKQSYGEKKLIFLNGSLPEYEGCYDYDYLAYFHPQDWYGENYLLDLVLAMRFGDFDAVGKGAYFAGGGSEIVLCGKGQEYHYVASLSARRCIFKPSVLQGKLLQGDTECRGDRALSVDHFNYCQIWTYEHCHMASDH